MTGMNLTHVFGIDMGTGSVKIYNRNTDTIAKEMNMIAVRNHENVFAFGNDAYEMYEKTPENIEVITPMSEGRIHDVQMMEAVLHLVMKKNSRFVGYAPVLFFSVPLDMTVLERRAYVSITKKGRFRRSRILFVEKPFADALAIGIPVRSAQGTMIVNIGAECTEISLLAEGRIILNRTIDIGGDKLNAAIISGVRRKSGLTVSKRTAHRLMLTLANLGRDKGEGCKAAGIDTDTGLSRDGIISSYTVSSSVREVIEEIAFEIRRVLDRLPPQIQAALQKEEIWLTGGGARVPGICDHLINLLGYPVEASEYYEYTTIEGLKQVADHTELRKYAFAPLRGNK